MKSRTAKEWNSKRSRNFRTPPEDSTFTQFIALCHHNKPIRKVPNLRYPCLKEVAFWVYATPTDVLSTWSYPVYSGTNHENIKSFLVTDQASRVQRWLAPIIFVTVRMPRSRYFLFWLRRLGFVTVRYWTGKHASTTAHGNGLLKTKGTMASCNIRNLYERWASHVALMWSMSRWGV